MARFYVNQVIVPHSLLDLPESVVRHLHVLRLRVGDTLTLFDGSGAEFSAEIQCLEKRYAQLAIIARHEISREGPIFIGLAQGISSGERMDFTLQKGVEMGVNVFQPLSTERTIVRLSGERAERKVERWQEIVLAACEQSGRNIIPVVHPIMSFEAWLREAQQHAAGARWILSPQGTVSLAQQAQPSTVWLMVGPEGGFSEAEAHAACTAGWRTLRLGARVLRTETAALAAVAAIQTRWGDYGA